MLFPFSAGRLYKLLAAKNKTSQITHNYIPYKKKQNKNTNNSPLSPDLIFTLDHSAEHSFHPAPA